MHRIAEEYALTALTARGGPRPVLTGTGLLLIMLAIASPSPCRGNDKAAFTVNAENAARYRKLLPEPVYRRVSLGQYHFRVVPVDEKRFLANYTARFRKASAANAGKYGIDIETGGLTDTATGKIPAHVFGLPFPRIDAEDPNAGVKIIHNYRMRTYQVDGSTHTFDLTDVTRDGNLIRRVKIRLSHKYYVGTTSTPPAKLPDNTASRQLAAALEPKDVAGVGVLTWRFHDWKTWDRLWAYLPNIRRVRRVRTKTRSERIPGFEVYGDDADCYDGKVTYFTWKLVRTGEVIGPLGGDTPYAHRLHREGATRWFMEFPYNGAVYESAGATGAGWLTLGNVFVRRPVWIVEGKPKDPYYEAGRIVLYVDRELYHAYYKIMYTRGGEQYQTTFCGQAWGKTADGSFGGPSALLMIGVNEKEDRGTPAGRFTRETFERGFSNSAFTAAYLSKLSGP